VKVTFDRSPCAENEKRQCLIFRKCTDASLYSGIHDADERRVRERIFEFTLCEANGGIASDHQCIQSIRFNSVASGNYELSNLSLAFVSIGNIRCVTKIKELGGRRLFESLV